MERGSFHIEEVKKQVGGSQILDSIYKVRRHSKLDEGHQLNMESHNIKLISKKKQQRASSTNITGLKSPYQLDILSFSTKQ